MRPLVRIPRRGYEATLAALLLMVLLVAGSPTPVPAQLPRTHFWVPNGTVEDLAIANGKVYLAGSFTQVGPATGAFVGFDRTTGLALQPIPEVSGSFTRWSAMARTVGISVGPSPRFGVCHGATSPTWTLPAT